MLQMYSTMPPNATCAGADLSACGVSTTCSLLVDVSESGVLLGSEVCGEVASVLCFFAGGRFLGGHEHCVSISTAQGNVQDCVGHLSVADFVLLAGLFDSTRPSALTTDFLRRRLNSRPMCLPHCVVENSQMMLQR